MCVGDSSLARPDFGPLYDVIQSLTVCKSSMLTYTVFGVSQQLSRGTTLLVPSTLANLNKYWRVYIFQVLESIYILQVINVLEYLYFNWKCL